jgi:hypothetical protein
MFKRIKNSFVQIINVIIQKMPFSYNRFCLKEKSQICLAWNPTSSLESYISKNKIWLPPTIFEGTQGRYITSAIWANGKIGIGYLMQSLPWSCIGKSAKNSWYYRGFYLIWGPKQSRCQPMLTLQSCCLPSGTQCYSYHRIVSSSAGIGHRISQG